MFAKKITRLLIVLAVAFSFYFIIYRPWQLNWGATKKEIKQNMPGDEVVKRTNFNATRAITIDATPEKIWPWMIQIGHKRAGWYSYDLIDNLAKPSAEKIFPHLLDLKPGDLIPISPDGQFGFHVKDIETNSWMLWGDEEGDLTWSWGLFPLNSKQTRLITRIRMKYDWISAYILFDLLLDGGDFVMMRQMLQGIKDRAERVKAASFWKLTLELFSWLAAFVAFIIAEIRIISRCKWWLHLFTAMALSMLTIILVMWQPALWVDAFFVMLVYTALVYTSKIDPKVKKKKPRTT